MNKSRKFVVLILMTVINVLYIVGSVIKPDIMQLMSLVMMLDGVYCAYMGLNVAQKKVLKK